MKSMYFVIKTVEGHICYAKTDAEITTEEFLGIFLDIAKEAKPITKEEYDAGTKEE